jgi:hypothetical protein
MRMTEVRRQGETRHVVLYSVRFVETHLFMLICNAKTFCEWWEVRVSVIWTVM